MPRGMRWVIFVALMFLIFTPSQVTHVREVLLYLRWVPLFVLGAAVLALAVRNRSLPRPLNMADLVILGFIILALLSSLYSLYPKMTLLRSLSVLLMYGAIFWGVWLYVDTFGVENLVGSMLIVLSLVFSLHLVTPVLSPSWAFYNQSGRLAGWAENPGAVGSVAALSMPLAIWQALSVRRWYSWMLVAAMLLCIILAHTRLEALAMILGSGYFLLRVLPGRKILFLALGAAYILVFVSWSIFSPDLYRRYISEFPKGLLEAEPEYYVRTTFVHITEGCDWRGTVAEFVLCPSEPVILDVTVPADIKLGDPIKADSVVIAPEHVAVDEMKVAIEAVESGALAGDAMSSSLDMVPVPRVMDDLIEVDGVVTEAEEVVVAGVPAAEETTIGMASATGDREPWYQVSSHPLFERYSIPQITTLGWRSQKWARGVSFLLERPLLGFGFGTEDQLFAFHGASPNNYYHTGWYMHNSYLGLALQVGLFGALLCFLPLAILMVREVRAGAFQSCEPVRIALLGVVLTGMTTALLSSWVYAMGNHNSFQFWICVMLLVRFSIQVDAPANPVREVAQKIQTAAVL